MFMGTPHLGTDTIHLALFAERLIHVFVPSKIMDTNSQFLDALKEGSDMLQEVTDNFVPLMKRFRIYFFWEQDKTNFGTKWEYVRLKRPLLTDVFVNLWLARLFQRHQRLQFWITPIVPV